MSKNRDGQVVTFYSYKGGTGRTMALANVAWILAANGKRVLVADWDLESPGLHRFFSPFIDPRILDSTGGVLDLLSRFEWATAQPIERPAGWQKEYARISEFTFSLNWRFPGEGTIDFLGAGRQNRDYAAALNNMDWDVFHEKLGGGKLLDDLRANMKQNYDYALIDSRTGFSDVADICTIHLPDTLVDCFTYSDQGIFGASQAAKTIQRKYAARNIRVLPVPMRVDSSEKLKADVSRTVAMQHFAGFPSDMSEAERNAYWAAVAVPYQSFYSYEETLATFSDQPGSPRTLLYAYEMLTSHVTRGEVTRLAPMDEPTRARTSARFLRQVIAADEEITLRYAPEDQVWAEWIDELLRSAGIRVRDPQRPTTIEAGWETSSPRDLKIVSLTSANNQEIPAERANAQPPLLVYVADVRPLTGFASSPSAFIFGLSADAAAERILKLVGRPEIGASPNQHGYGARFPGQEPAVFAVPARNARFTGRQDDLLDLRSKLRSAGSSAVAVVPGTMPVAVQGMGGIGKTQLAVEYAHRFRSSYDVVWWINSDPAAFIDAAVADLGNRLNIAPQPTVLETAKAVLHSLERGEVYGRWLLIFDNAEDLDRVGQFLPTGRGHVLITSRNKAWGDRARSIELEVFRRHESTAHLTQRVPTIRPDEANRIAEMLGDLPIAVAAAGAWLADTGTEVAVYLQQLEERGPSDASVDQTFHLALERLRQRSPAAFRLLQLCSVLSSEIDLELIYSDEMAAALTPFDPAIAERLVRGSLVQQINRLALLRLDVQRGQIQVHRVLQHVVRSQMSPVDLDAARHQVHLVLAASRPRDDVDDPQTWRRYRMLWPHLEVSDAINCPDEGVRKLLIDRVRYLGQRGDLPEGHRLAERIDRAWSRMLADAGELRRRDVIRRQLLHMRFNWANILRDEAHFDRSHELDEAVLAEQKELLGEAHPHTLITAGGLAADLRALGRYPEALRLDKETYATWADQYGEDHPRTLTALNNLASSYRHMGDFRAALDSDKNALARRQVVLGETHPHTLGSASNLGRDIREAGEYLRSATQLRAVTETLRERWGPDFRITLNAQANLATSLRSAGRAPEAADLLDTAYERLNDTLGPKGPDTVACRLSRAVNLLAVGQIDYASSELEAVHQAYEKSLGPDHPHTLLCVSNLAVAARASLPTNTSFARQRAEVASDALRRVLGPMHPYALAARVNLAVCTAEDGDFEAAYEPLKQTAQQLAEVLGADHPDTVRCEGNVALLSGKLRILGSEAMVNHALDRLVVRLGMSHPAVEALREGRFLHRIVEPHPF